MKYKVREKLFSLTDDFTIKNEYDEDSFYVRGKFLSIGHKLNLEDLNGNSLYYIEQKVLRFLPEYYIYDSNGKQVAKVKKQFTFFKPKFQIESDYGYYELNGNILDHDFEIIKNNAVCAVISKRWFSLSCTYGIDVSEKEDHAFILSLVIILDKVMDDQERRN
ncbi:LURP-one-related family protein [Clostridium sp.]|uniref:LURP-one-related/scramblase family protein n=1 Tax=Clostridium sp. TaxID=1506 RepID=UPI00284646F7|nr:LURP-one-related family protein [Clostridium sp.]MDR3598598.1 LURP-one-related family protein [Clostridium sp.]